MNRKLPGRPRHVDTPALLLPLVRRGVLEDPEHGLVGPDVDGARRLFSTWWDTASAARDGEGGTSVRGACRVSQPFQKAPTGQIRVVNAGPSGYFLEKFLPPRSEDNEDDENGEDDEEACDDGWM